LYIQKEFGVIDQSILLENNNLTEPGEDKLAAGIETGIKEYRESYRQVMKPPVQADIVLVQQKKFNILQQQLLALSKMNGKAIEVKTDDAKLSSKDALTGMTILGSFSFLIALSFIYSFASYFNERFFQLYNGIKEIVSSNYGQRLYFDGIDEFYEISLLFNQMAEKLSVSQSGEDKPVEYFKDFEDDGSYKEIDELKDVLSRLKSVERQAEEVISRIENKK
jgi:methyl-accepting chemotaxis protein